MKKNIAEILKYCPQGLPLWSPAYGNVCLKECTDSCIILGTTHGSCRMNAEGLLSGNGECMLFPSKEQRDWDKFWPYEDGDVLYIKTKRNEYAFIYRGQKDENYIGCYANLGNWNHFSSAPGEYVCHKANMVTIRYATEKEIDALHIAIEKEGKIWDPVKKELVNIEIVAAEEKAEKFDINKLKPFDRVLVRENDGQRWTGDLFLYKNDTSQSFEGVHRLWNQCIPYEGNETLLSTTEQPDEYYITWEEEK